MDDAAGYVTRGSGMRGAGTILPQQDMSSVERGFNKLAALQDQKNKQAAAEIAAFDEYVKLNYESWQDYDNERVYGEYTTWKDDATRLFKEKQGRLSPEDWSKIQKGEKRVLELGKQSVGHQELYNKDVAYVRQHKDEVDIIATTDRMQEYSAADIPDRAKLLQGWGGTTVVMKEPEMEDLDWSKRMKDLGDTLAKSDTIEKVWKNPDGSIGSRKIESNTVEGRYVGLESDFNDNQFIREDARRKFEKLPESQKNKYSNYNSLPKEMKEVLTQEDFTPEKAYYMGANEPRISKYKEDKGLTKEKGGGIQFDFNSGGGVPPAIATEDILTRKIINETTGESDIIVAYDIAFPENKNVQGQRGAGYNLETGEAITESGNISMDVKGVQYLGVYTGIVPKTYTIGGKKITLNRGDLIPERAFKAKKSSKYGGKKDKSVIDKNDVTFKPYVVGIEETSSGDKQTSAYPYTEWENTLKANYGKNYQNWDKLPKTIPWNKDGEKGDDNTPTPTKSKNKYGV